MNIFHRPQPPKWSASLCGCGGDIGTCCITCCLPCVTFGQIAEMVDQGQSRSGGFIIYHASIRTREKLRAKFGLPAEPCHDCCVHFCCEPCALCQEHAELKARGFDPSEGWKGPATAPPSMPPTMKR
ncbi:hypothetical protein PVK06_032764 [Gossypium arboreum]|uniref:Uncharacterized protein n=1 Tax=Gossypium arboreum TaxID=29729 RepID=A0ABR0NUR4_GOSAR|nr:hypothetical protein PVK06_032764 [Gossypium arboreum]